MRRGHQRVRHSELEAAPVPGGQRCQRGRGAPVPSQGGGGTPRPRSRAGDGDRDVFPSFMHPLAGKSNRSTQSRVWGFFSFQCSPFWGQFGPGALQAPVLPVQHPPWPGVPHTPMPFGKVQSQKSILGACEKFWGRSEAILGRCEEVLGKT